MKRWLVLAMVATGCGGGLSVSAFQDAARAAKTCDPSLGDYCVNAGASQCLCATAVNSSRAAEINGLAAQVSCGNTTVRCAPSLNPRCLDGQCVSDIQ